MCYRYRASLHQDSLRGDFDIAPDSPFLDFDEELNGFKHPCGPLVLDVEPKIVFTGEWGLLPIWAQEDFRQKNTLNCMVETAAKKPSFRSSVGNRCLVLASEFYEYKWEQPGNKKCKKHLHRIWTPGQKNFAMAGIYNERNGGITYTILTTAANTLMAEIHNNKKRMPVVLHKDEHALWLNGDPLEAFANRSELELDAMPVNDHGIAPAVQGSLF